MTTERIVDRETWFDSIQIPGVNMYCTEPDEDSMAVIDADSEEILGTIRGYLKSQHADGRDRVHTLFVEPLERSAARCNNGTAT